MAAFQVPVIFSAIDKMSAPIRRMQGATRGFANTVGVAEAKVVRGFRSMTRAVGQFGIALGATALIMIGGNAIGIFKDFEQANANLAAVMQKTVGETQALQNSAKTLGATTSFTASEVVALQTSYAKLGFVEDQILNMTASTLALAAATGTDLDQAATQVGAALNAFGLKSTEAARVADVFALASSKTALDMEKLAGSMDKVAPVAKQFGFGIEDSTALLGKLVDAGFDASTAGTATKNIMLNMADANGKLAKALGGPVTSLEDMTQGMIALREKGIDLTTMLDLTDKRSVAAFATFLEGSESLVVLSDALKNAAGAAQGMADKQLDTLEGSLIKLSSAYEGFILSMEDGTGPFAKTLRLTVDVAAAILSMAAGVEQANGPLTERATLVKELAGKTLLVLKIIKWTIAAYIGLKVVMAAVTAATWLYNTAQALSLAFQGKTLLFLKGNTAAMVIYKIAMFAVTAATWLWNTAQAALNIVMTANPIGLIIAAIALLIGLVTAVVVKYKDWGAAITLLMGPLGMIINLVMSFARHWDSITEAFSSGGILAGLKRIGLVLFDAILMPLQQMLELLSNLPGIGDLAADGAAAIEGLRANLDLINPEADKAGAQVDREERVEQQKLDININNKSGGQADVESSGDITPTITPTFAF